MILAEAALFYIVSNLISIYAAISEAESHFFIETLREYAKMDNCTSQNSTLLTLRTQPHLCAVRYQPSSYVEQYP